MQRTNSVLIVEDEDVQARNLSMLLEDSGYDVVGIVPTAEDALAVYQSCVPEFAVIDFNLGSAIDGLTLARHLSERYSTRVVIVTGNPGAVVADGQRFVRRLISKPYMAEDLLNVLHEN
jgi:ActR/RegA family two-component response regulator